MYSASFQEQPLSFLDEVKKPGRSERDIRASLIAPEGREGYLAAQQATATALNHEEAARQLAGLTRTEIADIGQEVAGIERELRWIQPLITRPDTQPGAGESRTHQAVTAGEGVSGDPCRQAWLANHRASSDYLHSCGRSAKTRSPHCPTRTSIFS